MSQTHLTGCPIDLSSIAERVETRVALGLFMVLDVESENFRSIYCALIKLLADCSPYHGSNARGRELQARCSAVLF